MLTMVPPHIPPPPLARALVQMYAPLADHACRMADRAWALNGRDFEAVFLREFHAERRRLYLPEPPPMRAYGVEV